MNFIGNMIRCLSFLSVLLAFVSCSKVDLMCDYTVKTIIQEQKDAPSLLTDQVVGYAFYADTLAYKVASYSEVVSGVLRDISGSGTKNSDIVAVFDYNVQRLVFNGIVKSPVILVVCDTKTQTYSFRQEEIPEGLPLVEVSLVSKPWMFQNNIDTTIVSNKWFQKINNHKE